MDTTSDPLLSVQFIGETATRLSQGGRWNELAILLDEVRREGHLEAPDLRVWEAEAALHLGNTHQSVALANELLVASQVPLRFKVKAYLIRSSAARLRGFLEAAVEDAHIALTLLEDNPHFVDLRIECHRQLGAAFGTMGEMDRSVQELEKGLQLCARSSDLTLMATVEDNLAIILSQLGQLSEALVYFERAKAAYNKLDNSTEQARVLNNIGRLYYDLDHYDASLEALREAVVVAKACNSKRVEASILINTGDTLQRMARYDEALPYYNQALALAEQVLEPRLFSQANIGAGSAYCRLQDYKKARILLRQAAYEAKKQGIQYEHSAALLYLAILSIKEADYTEAWHVLTDAVIKLEAIGAKRELVKGYVHLAFLCLKTKRWARLRQCLEFLGKIVRQLELKGQLSLEAAEFPEVIEYAASKRICGSLFQEIRRQVQGRSPLGGVETLPARSEGPALASLPSVEIHSLGDHSVFLDQRHVTEAEWRSQKAKELFLYLLCHRRGGTREQLLDVLWPDISTALSRNALYNNVYRVRKALYEEVILQDDGRYKLNPEGSFRFDLQEFQSMIDRADKLARGSRERAECLEQAVKLYRGSFLEDFYAEWSDSIRFEAEAMYLRSLARLAGFYAARGEYARATGLLEKLLEVDETNTAAHEQFIRALAKAGDLEAAYHRYNRYQTILMEQLGKRPDKSFQQICEEVDVGN